MKKFLIHETHKEIEDWKIAQILSNYFKAAVRMEETKDGAKGMLVIVQEFEQESEHVY